MRWITAALLALWFLRPAIAADGPGLPVLGGLTSPDGTVSITCNLPTDQRVKNRGGSDGAGLCVYTSVQYCASWQTERALLGLQAWAARNPGGSFPDKLARDLQTVAPGLSWIQDTTADVELLKLAIRTGRGVGVTYAGHDPFYGDQTIAHMVFLAHIDDRWAAIYDNNHPQDVVWMSVPEFIKRWRGEEYTVRYPDGVWRPVGGGWGVCLLRPGPTPYPRRRPTDVNPPVPQLLVGQPLIGQPWQPWPPPPWQPQPWPPGPIIIRPAEPEPQKQPEKPPEPVKEKEKPAQNFGLDLTSLRDRPGQTWCDGHLCPKSQAYASLTAIPASDESLPWLTVIGHATERARVLDDLKNAPALAVFRGKFRIQDYDPSDWPVKESFDLRGTPTIYVQSPEGYVLHRQSTYDGPEALAIALRKADPNYDPSKDPDLRKPVPGPKPEPKPDPDKDKTPKVPPDGPPSPIDLSKIPGWVWIMGAAVALLAILRRKAA